MKITAYETAPLGANSYIVVDEASGDCAVVDIGCCSSQILASLEDEKIKKVRYILLTHGHFDHINGVAELKKHYPDALVCIHEFDAKCLEDDLLSMARGFGLPECEKVKHDVLLHDGDELDFGNEKIKIIHTPGHTKGSVTFVIGDDLFTGDTLFRLTVGRTDFPGGSLSELKDSVKRLFDLSGDRNVYPGHNCATTLETERHENMILRRRKYLD